MPLRFNLGDVSRICILQSCVEMDTAAFCFRVFFLLCHSLPAVCFLGASPDFCCAGCAYAKAPLGGGPFSLSHRSPRLRPWTIPPAFFPSPLTFVWRPGTWGIILPFPPTPLAFHIVELASPCRVVLTFFGLFTVPLPVLGSRPPLSKSHVFRELPSP